MKTRISVFFTATFFLILSASSAFAQAKQAYFASRSNLISMPISDIDSIIFKRDMPEQLYILMDETTVNENLQSIDENGKMIFINMPDDKIPVAGNIIISSITDKTPYGFFYKVTSVAQNGNLTIIETEEASLEDVLEDVDISEVFDLDEDIIGIFDENDNPLFSTRSTQGSSTIDLSATIKDGHGELSLSGKLTIKNELIFDYTIQKRDVKYLKMAYKTDCNFEASIVGEIKGELPLWNFEVARIKFKPKIIMLGYFPLVLTPVIPISLKGDLIGGIKGDAKIIDSKNSLTVGVEYKKSELKSFYETGPDSPQQTSGSNVAVSGEIKSSIEP